MKKRFVVICLAFVCLLASCKIEEAWEPEYEHIFNYEFGALSERAYERLQSEYGSTGYTDPIDCFAICSAYGIPNDTTRRSFTGVEYDFVCRQINSIMSLKEDADSYNKMIWDNELTFSLLIDKDGIMGPIGYYYYLYTSHVSRITNLKN